MACVAIQMAVTHFAYAWVACIYLPGVNPQHNKDAWQHLKRKHSRAGQDRRLSQPVRGPSVRSISDLRHESCRRIVQQLLHPFDSIFITHVQPQLLL